MSLQPKKQKKNVNFMLVAAEEEFKINNDMI